MRLFKILLIVLGLATQAFAVILMIKMNLLEAIKSSLVQAAEVLLEEDCGVESSDVDIELLTIFEILNGEKPSGFSCTKFNLKFTGYLIRKLEDNITFKFLVVNIVRKNAIKYRTENKGYLEFS